MAIFSKLLTKTDIGTRLSVPTKSLKSLPCFGRGHAIDFHVQDAQSGEVWNFRCVIRKKSHPKPALCKNWRKFVSSKRLSVGDKIIFSTLAEDQASTGGAQYKIEVKRQTKIFGVSLGYFPWYIYIYMFISIFVFCKIFALCFWITQCYFVIHACCLLVLI